MTLRRARPVEKKRIGLDAPRTERPVPRISFPWLERPGTTGIRPRITLACRNSEACNERAFGICPREKSRASTTVIPLRWRALR